MELATTPDSLPPPFTGPKPGGTTPPGFTRNARDEEGLSFGIQLSIGLHAALAFFVIFQNIIFPGKPIAYIPSLRVDLVGLPDQLKEDLRSPRVESVPKGSPHPPQAQSHEQAAPDELVFKPVRQADPKNAKERIEKNREKKLENALARIKALAKISNDPTTPAQAVKASEIIKGNRISKGSSVSSEAQESDKDDYIGSLQNTLQQNWELPLYLERQQLNAQVMIFIDVTGRMKQYKFIHPSGNAQFDEAIKRTLLKSQPFPLPPPELSAELSNRGVLVGFPL